MSLKMECHAKQTDTHNGMSLDINVIKNEMSLKIECHTKLYAHQNKLSLNPKCHSKLNVTKKTLKMECYSK